VQSLPSVGEILRSRLKVSAPLSPNELGVSSSTFVGTGLYSVFVRGEAYLAAHQGSETAAESQKILDHRDIVLNEPSSVTCSAAGEMTIRQPHENETESVPGKYVVATATPTLPPNRRWQSWACCREVPMNRGDPLLFRCGLRRRGVQRELPSTITYSQKFRGSAQRESTHTFCGILPSPGLLNIGDRI
jgi:hypothetical protein